MGMAGAEIREVGTDCNTGGRGVRLGGTVIPLVGRMLRPTGRPVPEEDAGNGRNGKIELALHEMLQANMDLGDFFETKVTGGFYMHY